MNQITLTLYVDAAAAVREGRCLAGPCTVRLAADDIAALDPIQRDALARHLEDDTPRGCDRVRWGDPLTMHAAPIAYADAAQVAALLSCRALAMGEQATRDAADMGPIAVQRRIVNAVREVDGARADIAAQHMAAAGPEHSEAITLAALVRSPALWDACAQLRQCIVLEERPVIVRDVRTNPNPEIDR